VQRRRARYWLLLIGLAVVVVAGGLALGVLVAVVV